MKSEDKHVVLLQDDPDSMSLIDFLDFGWEQLLYTNLEANDVNFYQNFSCSARAFIGFSRSKIR